MARVMRIAQAVTHVSGNEMEADWVVECLVESSSMLIDQ